MKYRKHMEISHATKIEISLRSHAYFRTARHLLVLDRTADWSIQPIRIINFGWVDCLTPFLYCVQEARRRKAERVGIEEED
jgi:hypothetical protein